MKSRFKRPLPLNKLDDLELKARTPPRQHSPVKAEWKLDKAEGTRSYTDTNIFSKLHSLTNSFRSAEIDSKEGTQNVYQAALLLKQDFEKSLKQLKSVKSKSIIENPANFELIKSEVDKLSKNFEFIFQETYKQQQQILSLFENFEIN